MSESSSEVGISEGLVDNPKKTDTNPVSDLTASFLTEAGVLPDHSTFVDASPLVPWTRMGSETYLRADAVRYKLGGDIHQRDIAQQAILSSTGCAAAAKSRYERLELLRDSGAPTPPLYGLKGADVFTGYIHGVKNPKLGLRLINSDQTPEAERMSLLSQLARIAAVLDAKGFSPGAPFVDDLLFDGTSYYVVDTGFDLGGPNLSKPSSASLRALVAKCDPALQPAIEESYQHVRSVVK